MNLLDWLLAILLSCCTCLICIVCYGMIMSFGVDSEPKLTIPHIEPVSKTIIGTDTIYNYDLQKVVKEYKK